MSLPVSLSVPLGHFGVGGRDEPLLGSGRLLGRRAVQRRSLVRRSGYAQRAGSGASVRGRWYHRLPRGRGILKRRYGLPIGLIALAGIFCLTESAVADQLGDGLAAWQRGDYTIALRLLKPLAEQGVANAQFVLGIVYADGRGVPQNHAEAAKW